MKLVVNPNTNTAHEVAKKVEGLLMPTCKAYFEEQKTMEEDKVEDNDFIDKCGKCFD